MNLDELEQFASEKHSSKWLVLIILILIASAVSGVLLLLEAR